MSRRDLSQPSFVNAMVSGYGKVGGFLERIEQGFDWSPFEALASAFGLVSRQQAAPAPNIEHVLHAGTVVE
jgi:hypothetical protein